MDILFNTTSFPYKNNIDKGLVYIWGYILYYYQILCHFEYKNNMIKLFEDFRLFELKTYAIKNFNSVKDYDILFHLNEYKYVYITSILLLNLYLLYKLLIKLNKIHKQIIEIDDDLNSLNKKVGVFKSSVRLLGGLRASNYKMNQILKKRKIY